MSQIGGTQVGIHSSGLVLHGRHGELFIGELCIRMLSKALVDRAVDLLLHMPDETLPAFTTRGGELLDPFLFQAPAELRLAAPLP